MASKNLILLGIIALALFFSMFVSWRTANIISTNNDNLDTTKSIILTSNLSPFIVGFLTVVFTTILIVYAIEKLYS